MAPDQTSENSKKPLLSMTGISKSFPGVLANDSIDLDIYASEIHALLGENGARAPGQGPVWFYRSDRSIKLNGKELQIVAVGCAPGAGRPVFQDFHSPDLTVAENIACSLQAKAILTCNENRSKKSPALQVDIDPRKLVSNYRLATRKSGDP
jgi:ABC-type uncharacterized transport system ATPase subunit